MELRMKTIFERIIEGSIPSTKVFENERLIAIKDIAPQAPIHLLIIPKKVIPNLQSVTEADEHLFFEVIQVAQKLAVQFGIDESGYRLLVNNGDDAGQTIDHLHFHLLGGAPLAHMG
jgi:histidine triad (HIT) family protein